ncbi:MAG: MmpL family protein [Marmoricola sp.]|nr:MmpL family protein [Marmoricola sp.]
MAALQRLIVGRASALVGLVLLGLGILLVAGVGQATHTTRVDDALPSGADSTTAALIAEELPAQDASSAVVLFTGDVGGARLAALRSAVGKLDVDGVSSPGGPGKGAVLVPSKDQEAAISVLTVDAPGSTANAAAVKDLRAQLDRLVPNGVEAQVTGPSAVQADLAAVFDGADFKLLGATAGVVALLLIITYRSPVLWVVPLVVVGIADQAASVLATHTLAGLGVPWDESTTGILSVLVFGAGTDYALLLISRYRDELRSHEDRREAMRVALVRTSHAVLASATTVVLGVLCLSLSLVPTTRGLGIACAVGVVVAALFALVALPAVLVLFGRWVFWPRIPHEGTASLAEGRSLWRRVGDAVARRTTVFVVGTLALLAVLAIGLLPTRLGLPTSEQFLRQPEAIAASDELGKHFPAGSSDPASVLTRSPGKAAGALEQVDGVDSVRTQGDGSGWTELSVVLDDPPDSDAAQATVGRMRAALDDAGTRSHVGGTAAQAVDEGSGATRDRWVIFPLVLVLVLGALVLLLRSLVAPVLLVLTVLGTYVAALGVSWWLFSGVFGFSGVSVGMPLLAFLFLVALGVDYNIFLVTRAWEETHEHGSHDGMLRALAATGGVITSAGILLAAVFAVLGVLPLVVLAQLGVVICVGVLLDTLVVRTVLVPALALLLGDRFWWPRKVPARG